MKRQGFDKTKNRPIIVKFANLETRRKVLALRNLNYKNSGELQNIYITTDKTKKEQEEHRKLVIELKQRKQKGEDNIVIKNGRIVKMLPFRANPQSYWG